MQVDIIDDSTHIGITDCNVKISKVADNLVLYYFNTGDDNFFYKKIEDALNTRLLITLSRVGYADTAYIVHVTKDGTAKLEFYMRPITRELDPVTVKKPPMAWHRGDTTFYDVNAFRSGFESRLKEVIVNVPGFSIDAQGRLSYKGYPVEKILINGKELFAEQPSLLLNNFPVHLLKTIQAIENQNSNRLLKGFKDENKVVVNLALKKDGDVLFGSGDGGLGSNASYNLNPVLFALRNKINFAFTANVENIGNLENPNTLPDFKSRHDLISEPWLAQSKGWLWIPNFDYKWYIRNKRKDIRFTLQVPSGKRITNRTTISYMLDDQSQTNSNDNYFLADTLSIHRIDSTSLHRKPRILSIDHKLDYNIDTSKTLSVNLHSMYYDPYSGQQSRIYTNDILANTNEHLKTKWFGLNLNTLYTNKISSTYLQYVSVIADMQQQKQNGTNEAYQWTTIFPTANNLDNLNGNIRNLIYTLDVFWDHFWKLHTERFHQSLSFNEKYINYRDSFYLNDGNSDSSPYYINSISNSKKIEKHSIRYEISRSFDFKNINAVLNTQGSIAMTNMSLSGSEEDNTKISKPEMNVQSSFSGLYKVNTKYNFSVMYNQRTMEDEELSDFYRPLSMSLFSKNSSVGSFQKSLEFNSLVNWSWSKDGLYPSSLNVHFKHFFTNQLNYFQVENFFQYSIDSTVNMPSNTFSISLNQSIPSLLFNGLFKVGLSYASNQYYTRMNERVFLIPNQSLDMNFSFKKKIGHVYSLQLSSNPTMQFYSNSYIDIGGFVSKMLNIKSAVMQSFVLGGNTEFKLNSSWFNYNVLTKSQKKNILFMDMQFQNRLKKTPIVCGLNLNNITNVKYYYGGTNNLGSQTLYSLPLNPRRILFNIRYEF
ncbi:MAG: hypothetical protein QM610_00215 [Chitinophagaceae bacterium]